MPAEVTVTVGFQMLAVADLVPTPDNPRKVHDPRQEEELAESVGRDGVLQPVLVRPHPAQPGKWDLRAGSRRLAAAKLAGLTEIPCIVREMDDKQALRVTVVENLQREDLSPMESALALEGLARKGWETDAIAEEIGKSPGWVARRRHLLKLSEPWQKAVLDAEESISQWPVTLLELVARLPVPIQAELLLGYRANEWGTPSIPHRAELEENIGGYTHELARAPWKKDDPTLVDKVPACSKCLNRTGAQPSLFDDVLGQGKKRDDRCLDPDCWDSKAHAHVVRRTTELHEKHGKGLVYVLEGYRSDIPDDLPAGHLAVNQYSVRSCKKSEKGARPCIRINGSGTGELFYAHTTASSGSRSSKRLAGPTPLCERREQLKGRRAKRLIELVLKELADDLRLRTLSELVRLAAFFGTGHADGYRDVNTWKGFRMSGKSRGCREVREILWARIKPVLREQLDYHDVAGATSTLPHAKEICDYLGLDYGAMWLDVLREIPDPKAWEKLNEDGSPKKPAKAKAKKEAKPKEAKPVKGVCRECGCTHTTPCLTDGVPCAWTDETETLCTACATKKAKRKKAAKKAGKKPRRRGMIQT